MTTDPKAEAILTLLEAWGLTEQQKLDVLKEARIKVKLLKHRDTYLKM